MPATPTVSVVLPTYNRADQLLATISSVLDQTLEAFELLVIDDGSTDHTHATVSEFDDDPRIDYRRFEQNRGANAARNAGIEAASGEYVAFIDSDDRWLPEKLERQVSCFEDAPEAVGLVYTAYWQSFSGEREYCPASHHDRLEGDILSELVQENFITTSTALVHRDCFDSVGTFDEALPRLQDWELWLRVAREFEVGFVDEPLVEKRMYVDDLAIGTDRAAMVEALQYLLEKHEDIFERSPAAMAAHEQLLGHLLLRERQPAEGRRYLLRSLRRTPGVANSGALLASLLGAGVYNTVWNTIRHLGRATGRLTES